MIAIPFKSVGFIEEDIVVFLSWKGLNSGDIYYLWLHKPGNHLFRETTMNLGLSISVEKKNNYIFLVFVLT